MSPDQAKPELERLTNIVGGGKLKDGVSAGTLMVQTFINSQIDAANKEKKDSPLKGRKHLVMDGDNGGRTKAAIKLYQEQHRLDAQDGVVGLETYTQMTKDGFKLEEAIKASKEYLESPAGKKYAQEITEAKNAQETAYRMEKAKAMFRAPDETIAPKVEFRPPVEDLTPDFVKAQAAAKLREIEPQMRAPAVEQVPPKLPDAVPQMREPSSEYSFPEPRATIELRLIEGTALESDNAQLPKKPGTPNER